MPGVISPPLWDLFSAWGREDEIRPHDLQGPIDLCHRSSSRLLKMKIGIRNFNVGVQCVKAQFRSRLWILFTLPGMREREYS